MSLRTCELRLSKFLNHDDHTKKRVTNGLRRRIYEFSRKSYRFYDVARKSLRDDEDDDDDRKSRLVSPRNGYNFRTTEIWFDAVSEKCPRRHLIIQSIVTVLRYFLTSFLRKIAYLFSIIFPSNKLFIAYTISLQRSDCASNICIYIFYI